jgi:Tol biopolymer transport system component
MTTNERDPKHFDLYEVTTDGYQRTLLYKNETGLAFRAISPDKQLLAFAKTRTRADSDVILHDRRTGETTNLTPHEGEAVNDAQEFGSGGDHLFYRSNEGSEFLYLVRHHLDATISNRESAR